MKWLISRTLIVAAALFMYSNRLHVQACPKRVATIEEPQVAAGTALRSASMNWIRTALFRIDTMIKLNSYLSAIPEARLRNYLFAGIYYEQNDAPKLTATMNAVAYSKKGWDDGCGIIPQADRIAADESIISFALNNTDRDKLGSPRLCTYHDEQLKAFYEPQPAGTIAGLPVYDIGRFNVVLLTYNDQLPWTDVSLNEALDFTERKLSTDINRNRAQLQQFAARRYDEAAALKVYDELKKKDSEKAAAYLATIRQMKIAMDENATAAAKELAQQEKEWQQQMLDLQNYRHSLSATALAAPAYTGKGKYDLCFGEGCLSSNKLVKLKPGFIPYVKDKRIKIISIRYNKTSNQPGWADQVQKTVASLDYPALKRLMK